MKRSLIILALAGINFTAFACASTDVTGIVDPRYEEHAYGKVLVWAPSDNLEYRSLAEKAFVEELASVGCQGMRAMDIVLPTREYSDEELDQVLREHAIDAILIVVLSDSYSSKFYVPQSSHTTGTAYSSGYSTRFSSTTYNYGGYTISKPRQSHVIELVDVATGETAWVASTHTRGNAYAGRGTMLSSLAEATIGDLLGSHLLALLQGASGAEAEGKQ